MSKIKQIKQKGVGLARRTLASRRRPRFAH